MSRYSKYFLEHALWLEDDFCQYYLQDDSWGRKDILDVQSLIFFWPDEAERWLGQCADFDHYTTLRRLRRFLCDDGLETYPLHRMNDKQVLRAAARQISLNAFQMVIEPKTGWAVQVDPDTAEPVQPIAVEAEPELAPLLDELKVHLDALVAEQRQKYDQYEARLAGMSAEQKALLYAQKTGGAVYDSTVGGALDLVKAAPGALVRAARAFPGFYRGYLRLLWKVARTPSKMATLTARGLATGDFNPLEHEIDQIVSPLAQGYQQAQKYKSMLTVILSDDETYHLLYDFGQRYWDATHPVELTEMGASAVADIVVTVILAMVTAGIGAAANVAARSGRLAKAAELLEKIAAAIRRMGHRTKLIGKAEDAFKAGKAERRAAKTAHKIKTAEADLKHAEQVGKIEKQAQKEYDAANVIGGPKTTTLKKLNPLDDPKIAKEIQRDPNAVNGYSPKPGSSLDKFKIDWSNPKEVEFARSERIKYLEKLKKKKKLLENEVETLKKEGMSIEDIARKKVQQRNQERIDSYIKSDNIEGLKAMKERNLIEYGRAEGPTADQLFESKGSWEEVIFGSVKSSAAMDVLTGLY